jgi:hypothetical protein
MKIRFSILPINYRSKFDRDNNQLEKQGLANIINWLLMDNPL